MPVYFPDWRWVGGGGRRIQRFVCCPGVARDASGAHSQLSCDAIDFSVAKVPKLEMVAVLSIKPRDAFFAVLDDGYFLGGTVSLNRLIGGLGWSSEVEINFPEAVGWRSSPDVIARIFRIGRRGEKRFGNGVG